MNYIQSFPIKLVPYPYKLDSISLFMHFNYIFIDLQSIVNSYRHYPIFPTIMRPQKP